MLGRKINLVVGLTTFHNEMLQISVPALGKLNQKFMLIVHNDNPVTTVTKKQIRDLGYNGDIFIINSSENVGTFRARIAITEAIGKLKISPDWIIFNDDDDIITDLTIPDVSNDIFSVVQNSVVIHHRILDLLRAKTNPDNLEIDGDNITLSRPNLGFAGTLIRTNIVIKLFAFLKPLLESIKKLDDGLDFRAPVDAVMRVFLNMYAKFLNPDSAPIYMDKINYIKTDIDSCQIKYEKLNRPVRNISDHYRRALIKYENLMQTALNAAALRG